MSTSYKFRAECPRDCDVAFAILTPWVTAWSEEKLFFDDHRWSGEVEGSFTLKPGSPPQDFLVWILDKAGDMHVLTDTLELAENYTGERKYTKTPRIEGRHLLFLGRLNAAFFREYLGRWLARPEMTISKDIREFLTNLDNT